MAKKNDKKSWQAILQKEKQKTYFLDIIQHIKKERESGKSIYPKQQDIFNALKLTPLEKLKIVILGQDPYHGEKQAHGLAFSVQHDIKPPPSLKNIFKELKQDLNIPTPNHGCLEKWAKQGVLLLNTCLSVEDSKPQSHAKVGWQTFTDTVIKKIDEHTSGTIFLLWGAHAQKKEELINDDKHYVLKTSHPSPLSASRGFIGCGHFSKSNDLLISMDKAEIDWSL